MFNKILALERTDVKKPRQEGITSISDKLQPADIDNFKKMALFVDYVKIPNQIYFYIHQLNWKDV